MAQRHESADVLPPGASAVIGGPLGRRAAARERSPRRLVPLVVALILVPMVGAVTRQGHCIANGWNGDDQFWRGCFSDLPAQYQIAGLDTGLGGWLTSGQEPSQLPLVTGLMALLGGLVPGDPGWLGATRWYFALWTLLVVLCLALVVWCVARLRPGRLDLATQVALSPVYVVAALLSADMVVVALVLAAHLASALRRPVLAGLLLGLALTGHVWVAAVLVALVVAEWRGAEAERATRTVAVALGTAAAIGIVLLIGSPGLVTGPVTAWWGENAGYGSVLMIPQILDHPLPVRLPQAVALVGWVVAVGLVLVMARWARRAGRPAGWAQLAALAVAVVAVTGTSVPVQAALWVLPLAILAGISWRTHLGFVAMEVVHASALWLYIGAASNPDVGLPAEWYSVVVIGRALAWAFLVWGIWWTPVTAPDAPPQPPFAAEDRPQEPVPA